nr:hypothetical protein Iba_chr06eCG0440 [Ipomoea batatas]
MACGICTVHLKNVDLITHHEPDTFVTMRFAGGWRRKLEANAATRPHRLQLTADEATVAGNAKQKPWSDWIASRKQVVGGDRRRCC